jgi:hypothetical protein
MHPSHMQLEQLKRHKLSEVMSTRTTPLLQYMSFFEGHATIAPTMRVAIAKKKGMELKT